MVKSPSTGNVKTRLRSHLSDDERVALYSAFVVDSAATLAASGTDRRVIAFSPATAKDEIRSLVAEAGAFDFTPQPGGELGQRMAHLLAWSFEGGAGRTVLLGSDSPSLPAALIDEALTLLAYNELVIGPSTDGGYYLIGQSILNVDIFNGIDWSTGLVLEQTLAAAPARLALLPPWYDVDTPSDAAFLRSHLEALNRAGQACASLSLGVLRRLQLPAPS